MIYVCDADGCVSCAHHHSLTLKELCRLAKAFKVQLPKRVNRKEDIYDAVAQAGKLPRFVAKTKEIDKESESGSESDDSSSSGSSSSSSASGSSSGSSASSASASSSGSSGSSASGSSASGSSGSSASSSSSRSSSTSGSSASDSHKKKRARVDVEKRQRKPKTSTEDMTRLRNACAQAGLSTVGGADCLKARLLSFAALA